MAATDLEIVDVTPATWHLFDELLGPQGLQGGCWCSYFRLRSGEYDRARPAERKAFVRDVVDAGKPFGLVALHDGVPVGWVSVAPRQDFARLQRSRVAATDVSDVERLWAVVCFYVRRSERGTGAMSTLLRAAVDRAGAGGAAVVEGYPVDPGDEHVPPGGLYHGTLQAFLDGGFHLVERRGPRRALVRRVL
jgi:GNAT superfamily N-acetyltransferase